MTGAANWWREHTLIVQIIVAGLGLLATLPQDFLDHTQAVLFVGVINAVGGVINGLIVRPIPPAVFAGFFMAAAALAAGYGIHIPQETIGALNVLVVLVTALLLRTQVSPVGDLKPTVPAAGEVA